MIRRKEYYLSQLFFFICLSLIWLPGLEGQSRLSKKKKRGQTRAVLVGISDYQNISDLSYAHRDAQVYAQFLRSRAGGQVPEENIKLLTDSVATLAAIKDAFDWLVKNSKTGDRATIYISGHGDVEKVDSINRGYILAYDSPFNNYHLNAISVQDIDEVVRTLTVEKGVEVLFISDACRSGTLAGENTEGGERGANVTAQEMSKLKDKALLIMSCQPHQESQEGKQWGGGRGAFSYHLVNGLVGMADKLPKDKKLKVLELRNYLTQEFALNSSKQLPKIEASPVKELYRVNERVLEFVLQAEDRSSSLLEYDVATSTNESSETDSLSLIYKEKMLAAIEKSALIQPEGESAYDYFKLLKERNFSQLNDLKSKLTIALQDEAQQALNAYLNSDPEELNNRWNYDEKYSRFPRYLETAAAILGSYDKYYPELMAKKHYFDGLILRLQGEKESNKNTAEQLFRLGLNMQDQALKAENLSAFIYNELGLLHKRLKNYDEAIPYFEKAIELSPSWVMAYNNLATIYLLKKDFDTAEAYGTIAVNLDSTIAYPYRTLGQALYRKKQYEEAEQNLFKSIQLSPNYPNTYYTLGIIYRKLKEYDKSEKHYLKAIELNPSYLRAINNLSALYLELGKKKEAERFGKMAISIDKNYYRGYITLSKVYLEDKEYEEAENLLQSALQLRPNDFRVYNRLGELYTIQEKYDQSEKIYLEGLAKAYHPLFNFNLGWVYLVKENFAQSTSFFQQYVEASPKDADGYFMIACNYALEGNAEECQIWLDKAEERKFKYYDGLLHNDIRKKLKKIEVFEELIRD